MCLTCFIILNNMKRGFMKNIAYAFTLAEIMIVLVVIGILTGILVPAAMNSMPNENVMKFKKAHNTLYRVINELVSSDKYYADGDLGKRPNGDLIDGTHSGDYTYLCQSFADNLSTKSVNCSNTIVYGYEQFRLEPGFDPSGTNTVKPKADAACKDNAFTIGSEIITTDNVIYYQTSAIPFGATIGNTHETIADCYTTHSDNTGMCATRWFNGPHKDSNGFDRIYKVFCMDIDGIGTGEDPFGYGIRADGKILNGERADKWLEKSIQEKE